MNSYAEIQLPAGAVDMSGKEQADVVGGMSPYVYLALVVLVAAGVISGAAAVGAVVGGITYALGH
jgi:hypothetical protein